MALVLRKNPAQTLELTDTLTVDLVTSELNFAWVGWIHTSINKHFEDRRLTFPLYLEGDERVENDQEDFAELRIDGPFILNPHKDLYYLDIEVNVLLQSVMDPKDLYKMQRLIGIFLAVFTNKIDVFKFGDGPLDDSTLLGCFKRQRDLKERIDVNYFGIIRQDTRVIQATIEAHYRLEL